MKHLSDAEDKGESQLVGWVDRMPNVGQSEVLHWACPVRP
jgi:hypothetical protein